MPRRTLSRRTLTRRALPRTLAALAVTGLLAAPLLTACAGSSSSTAGTPAATPSGGITVFAASSLTGAFTTLADRFERAHPGTTITLNVGGSPALATQITQGAPADVYASASTATMDAVVAAQAANAPITFATNRLQIAVPPTNPAGITSLNDLATPGVKVALCQPAVPCGATARQVFRNATITVTPVTEEPDVKAALAKVQLGEVDAAVVYVTDVLAARGSVLGVPIPAEVNAATAYPIATLTGSKNPALAQAFVDDVLSTQGRQALTAAGFAVP